MNKLSRKGKVLQNRVDDRTIRLIVTLICLVLFILAAGAPSGLGGVGMQSVDNDNFSGLGRMNINGFERISTNGLEHFSRIGLDHILP